jgi:hypothetical protein
MKKKRTLHEFMDLPPSLEKPVVKEQVTEPYFVTVKGCINCDVCAANKERHGTDYGSFDHELMVACLLRGCDAYHHTICKPFMHPAEIRRLAKANGKPDIIEKAERIALQIEEAFKVNGWTL